MQCTYPNRRQLISLTLAIVLLLLLAFYYRSQGPFSFHAPNTSYPASSVQSPKLTSSPPRPPPPPSPPPPASSSDPKRPQNEPSTPHNLTRTLVIASLLEEDTTWASSLSSADPTLTTAIYIVDNPTTLNNTTPTISPYLTVPANKGHEAMVYLTYIIDTYHALPDISIFMHAHAVTWHNNDFLSSSSSAQAVQRLRSAKVLRDGYMNLRCHHNPGCPDHIHPTIPTDQGTTKTTTAGQSASASDTGETQSQDDILNIPESAVMGQAWTELFPTTPIPRVLSQPCCGQFAVSADRIRSVPRERYVEFRNWLLATALDDRLSGRVWEYLWQYVFGRVEEYCPDEYTCYCEGYGVCFGGDKGEYLRYFELRKNSTEIREEIERLKEGGDKDKDKDNGRVKERERELEVILTQMEEIKAKSGGS
ncbi:hypothetical protein BDDG_07038 [Blastomyces dermatitidis ATCC 18188]|uniref:Uncharacterized protein n=1 Tax=Ajellomyces dermatitidis (strain ATCC 18188 / CBS 674.68) TaxID=653446 RepID=F2TLK4_AJEDA|nr:hypothetical protein BDDG_07038 [Blastomyces dermatitidis ATCC 18188]